MKADWSQAPEWATMFGLAGIKEIPVWYSLSQYQHTSGSQCHRIFSFDEGHGFALHDIQRLEMRPTTPPSPEWDGEGLPPVGCECERQKGSGEWIKACILGYHDRFVWLSLEDRPDPVTFYVADSDFRPLRTKEQREREELSEAVEAALGKSPGLVSRESLTTHLFNLNVRKVAE